MENFLKLSVAQANDFWKGIDSSSRRKIIIAAVMLLAVAATITWLITKPDYTVLYSGLESREAGEILQKLEEMKVDAKPEGTGTIKVPRRDEAKIRMQLSAEGYPKSGYNNYDFFKSGMGLGATDYDKRKAEQYQLQDRLQTAIKTMDGVVDAIVTISIPEQDSFVLKEDKQPVTASVLLNLGNGTMTSKQIKGIEELVSKSVLGLKPENISILDSNMNTLNANTSGGSGVISEQLELEKQVRDSLQRQVLALLEPVFGKSNVVSSASFQLNFDKKVTNSVRFEPVTDEDGITVSINELKEEVNNRAATTDAGSGDYSKSNKTINYEVNKINEQLEEAQGKMTNLKLSVLINNDALDSQTLSAVQKLVSNAIGVDTDKVEIQGMAFNGAIAEQEKMNEAQRGLETRELIGTIVEIVRYAFLIFVILFILYSLYKFIMKIKISQEQFKDLKTVKQTGFYEEIIEMPEEDKEQMAKKQRIDTLVDSKPDIVAQQVRDWLNEN